MINQTEIAQILLSLRSRYLELGGSAESLLALLPVNNGPYRIEVRLLDVLQEEYENISKDLLFRIAANNKNYLVVEVESVLPKVNTKDGSESQERILVGGGYSLELLGSGVDSLKKVCIRNDQYSAAIEHPRLTSQAHPDP